EARRQVEKLSAGTMLNQGSALCERGEVARGLLWLVRSLELASRTHDRALEQLARINLAAWKPFLVRERARFPHAGWVLAVGLRPDGRTALTGSSDGTARFWDTATGKPRWKPLRHPDPVWAVAWSPDGKLVLTGCGPLDPRPGEARMWDARTGRLL